MQTIKSLIETFSLPALIACLGALVSAGGAIWASYEQNITQRISVNQTLKITEFNTKILELSEESKTLAIRGIDSITGGSGFVYVDIVKGVFPNAFAPIVATKSEFPQYDVSIRFFDTQKEQQTQISNPFILNIPTVTPHDSSFFKTPIFELPSTKNSAQYNLFISARNGSFIEKLYLKKIESEWYSAILLTKLVNNVEVAVMESAMTQYPRTADGKIDW